MLHQCTATLSIVEKSTILVNMTGGCPIFAHYMLQPNCDTIDAMEQNLHAPTELILHGHFYQPPRENPLVEIIPKQPSAKPYQDWNERIYDDCYRANAFSRYLDGFGHVRDIVNNYEYISFNFGPTLLSWIERYHLSTYRKILEADRKSLERLGHGNAIAQSYNHTILPLASASDAKIQIRWGIDDFVRRFGREPEGMWLPETAINTSVISLLRESGIKFVILSPWQCKAVQTTEGSWQLTSGDQVPYDRPFLLEGSDHKSLPAFFYHPQLASSISFGHMLRDADAMYRSLEEIVRKDRPQLLHTATDGEIYGHHEPFGDMALAALIRKVRDGSSFRLTNYGTFLEHNPPTLRAVLHEGEEAKGTSWSCSHGVSRWYKDCGCHTGGEQGWNQQWRTPLRESFDLLASRIDAIYENQVSALFSGAADPQELLAGYAAVIDHFESIEQYLSQWENRTGKPVQEKQRLAQLLEGQRFKQYSFTSCGWFFSDLAGIEPRQNIQYAVRAIQLYQPFTDEDLFSLVSPFLTKARSNRKHEGSAQTIAKSFMALSGGEAEAAAYFLMNQTFARTEDHVESYGKYRLLAFTNEGKNRYRCDIHDTRTLGRYRVTMQVRVHAQTGYAVTMEIREPMTGLSSVHEFSSAHIPPRMLDEVYTWIDRSMSRITDEELRRIATDIRHYSLLVKNGRTSPSETLYVENMGTCLRALRSLFTTPDTLPWEDKRESISHLLEFIKRKGRQHEQDIVRRIFTAEINRIAAIIASKGFSYERGSYLLEVIDVARTQGVQPAITLAQEAMHAHIKGPLRETYRTPLTMDILERLQTALNFSAER